MKKIRVTLHYEKTSQGRSLRLPKVNPPFRVPAFNQYKGETPMARYKCLASAVLLLGASTSASAIAQGCSNQLIEKFTAGWSNDMPSLLATLTDDIVYEDTTLHVV